jgi:hypothetical protein
MIKEGSRREWEEGDVDLVEASSSECKEDEPLWSDCGRESMRVE